MLDMVMDFYEIYTKYKEYDNAKIFKKIKYKKLLKNIRSYINYNTLEGVIFTLMNYIKLSHSEHSFEMFGNEIRFTLEDDMSVSYNDKLGKILVYDHDCLYEFYSYKEYTLTPELQKRWNKILPKLEDDLSKDILKLCDMMKDKHYYD